jgi:hypothetical protein
MLSLLAGVVDECSREVPKVVNFETLGNVELDVNE